LPVIQHLDCPYVQATSHRDEERDFIHEHDVDTQHHALIPVSDVRRNPVDPAIDWCATAVHCLPFEPAEVRSKDSFSCRDVAAFHWAICELITVHDSAVGTGIREHHYVLYFPGENRIPVLPFRVLSLDVINQIDKRPRI
jgi:hypothetical protein